MRPHTFTDDHRSIRPAGRVADHNRLSAAGHHSLAHPVVRDISLFMVLLMNPG